MPLKKVGDNIVTEFFRRLITEGFLLIVFETKHKNDKTSNGLYEHYYQAIFRIEDATTTITRSYKSVFCCIVGISPI